MSWNHTTGAPLWSGNTKSSVSSVGNLYITPQPETIEQNPSLGLEERNEIPLPTKYKDLSVKTLEAETINGNPNYDASKWSLFPAIHEVTAQLSEPFDLRQYDLKGFKDVVCSSVKAKVQGPLFPEPDSGTIEAELYLKAPLGTIGIVKSASVEVGASDSHGGALYVYGGTTLDGGDLHGTSIGSLPIGGINSVRLDVLPIGIDMVSPTYVTIDAGAAANIAAGGGLSLAGGSYVEINTDQTYFINSTAGNDNTDVYVGNIFPAFDGSQDLRINGGTTGRGVKLTDGSLVSTKVLEADLAKIPQYSLRDEWDFSLLYNPNDLVKVGTLIYKSLISNLAMEPTTTIPAWTSGSSYEAYMYVLDPMGDYYVCTSYISPSDTQPSLDPVHWTMAPSVRSITDIWTISSTTLHSCITFPPVTGDTTFLSIAKPTDQDTICIVKRDAVTEAVISSGKLYDDTINPPPGGDPSTWSQYSATEAIKAAGQDVQDAKNLSLKRSDNSTNGSVTILSEDLSPVQIFNIQTANNDSTISSNGVLNLVSENSDVVLLSSTKIVLNGPVEVNGNIDCKTNDILNVNNINLDQINGTPVSSFGGDPSTWYLYPSIASIEMESVTGTPTLSITSDSTNAVTCNAPNGNLHLESSDLITLEAPTSINFTCDTINFNPFIGSYSTLEMNNGAISSLSTLNGIDISNYLSSEWSKSPAVQDVYIDTHNIFGVTGINGSNNIASFQNSNWASNPANAPVDINSKAITGVTTINTIPIAGFDNSNWSTKTAIQDVYFDTHNIFGVTGINGSNNIASFQNSNWAGNPANAPVDINSKAITGVTTINTIPIADLNNTNWAGKVANAPVNFNSQAISGVTTINGINITDLDNTNWATDVAIQDLDMNNKGIKNLATLNLRQLFGFIEVYKTTAQSNITASTATPITWNGSTTASTGTSVSGSTITFGKVGVWRVTATIPISNASGTSSTADIWVRRNGTDVSFTSANFSVPNGQTTWASVEFYVTAAANTDNCQIIVGCPVVISIPTGISATSPFARPARTALAHAQLIY